MNYKEFYAHMKYEDFFNRLEEAGNTPLTLTANNHDLVKERMTLIDQLNERNPAKYILQGLDSNNRICYKYGSSNDLYILSSTTKSAPMHINPATETLDSITLVKGPKQLNFYLQGFDITENAKDWLEENYCRSHNLTLQNTEAEENGMWKVTDNTGKVFLVKVYPDKEGDYQAELFNENGDPIQADQSKTDTNLTSNKLTNTDIQRVGGEVVKFLRRDILKNLKSNTSLKDIFKNASIQIIGTGKQRESKLQSYKRRLYEADITSEPVDFRAVVSLLPSADPGDAWSKEEMEKLLDSEKKNLLQKYAKGISIKDPKAELTYLVTFADLNNLKVSDDKGFQGYFDLAATKVIKADNIFQKAKNFINNNAKPLDGSASVDHR